jgi:hypothetical protein
VATEDQEEADVRRRSVAHTLCREFHAASEDYQAVCRAGTVDQLSAVAGFIAENTDADSARQQALLWLDLAGDVPEEDLATMRELLTEHELLSTAGCVHIVLTASDSFSADEARSEWLEDLADDFDDDDFDDIELSGGSGQSQWMKMDGVTVDMLHEDFKIGLEVADDAGAATVSLLDIFEPDTLATVVGGLLGKPVAAIYRGDTPTDVLFRLCVSDVGFLHKLRDQFLTGDFASQLEVALQQLAEEQTERGSMSGRKILLDRTYFANVRSCCRRRRRRRRRRHRCCCCLSSVLSCASPWLY